MQIVCKRKFLKTKKQLRNYRNCFILKVPQAGLEPALAFLPTGF